jgi:hypothetical protein
MTYLTFYRSLHKLNKGRTHDTDTDNRQSLIFHASPTLQYIPIEFRNLDSDFFQGKPLTRPEQNFP